MSNIARLIEQTTEVIAKIMAVLTIALVLLICGEVLMRYVFDRPTIWNYEVIIMLGGTIWAYSWAYATKHKSHVRIDVFYNRLSARGQAFIDVVLTIVFFYPLILIFTKTSIDYAITAYVSHEVSVRGSWFPVLWPFRTLMAGGFILLLLQSSLVFVRDCRRLLKGAAS